MTNWNFIGAVEGVPILEPLRCGQVLLLDGMKIIRLTDTIPPGKRVRISVEIEE